MKLSDTWFWETQILENHLDTFAHVNNATYLELYEMARWAYVRQFDITLESIHRDKVGPVILEVNLKFRRELKNQDRIKISMKCLSYENKMGKIEQKIFNLDDKIMSEALFHFAIWDFSQRKIITAPENWTRALEL